MSHRISQLMGELRMNVLTSLRWTLLRIQTHTSTNPILCASGIVGWIRRWIVTLANRAQRQSFARKLCRCGFISTRAIHSQTPRLHFNLRARAIFRYYVCRSVCIHICAQLAGEKLSRKVWQSNCVPCEAGQVRARNYVIISSRQSVATKFFGIE